MLYKNDSVHIFLLGKIHPLVGHLKMRSFFLLSLLTLAVEKVSSQAGAWEKCEFTNSLSWSSH